MSVQLLVFFIYLFRQKWDFHSPLESEKSRFLHFHGKDKNAGHTKQICPQHIGEREPGVYGNTTFADLNRMILSRAEGLGLECEIFQSNHEGAIIDKLHAARTTFDGVIINAGAYTHYSYAIHDAIHDIRIPCVEVHISNIYARDEFRSHSVLSPVCAGTIAGFGINGYFLALQALSEM